MRSQDGQITVDVVGHIGDAVFPAADFSIVNAPLVADKPKELATNIYNSPVQRHICLVMNRHSRKDKTYGLAGVSMMDEGGLTYLDTVHLWYEKPSTSSNIGLLPIAEEGYLFYKGDAPNVKNTSWFAEGLPNASNMWGLTPSEGEGRAATHCKHFAWEVGLLLYTMASPVQMKRFVYALDEDHEHVLKFAKHYSVQVHFIVTSDSVARNILSRYEVT